MFQVICPSCAKSVNARNNPIVVAIEQQVAELIRHSHMCSWPVDSCIDTRICRLLLHYSGLIDPEFARVHFPDLLAGADLTATSQGLLASGFRTLALLASSKEWRCIPTSWRPFLLELQVKAQCLNNHPEVKYSGAN